MHHTKVLEQLISSVKQQNRMLKLTFPNNDVTFAPQLVANFLTASEQLNHDFEFVVEVLSDHPDLPLNEMLGKMASIECLRHDGSSRYFNGYVFGFKLLKNDGGLSRYEMVLKPWLAFLRHRQDCRVFQELSLKDRSQNIFKNCIYSDVAWDISGQDPETTFSVQFNESDYNYLNRQWEKAGWVYWYEHRKDGHTLNIVDQTQNCKAIQNLQQELVWRGNNASNTGVGIISFSDQSQMRFSSYSAMSFDFKAPDQLQSEFSAPQPVSTLMPLENYVYTGTYGFKDTDQGSQALKLLSQADDANQQVQYLISNDAYAEVGHWFKLAKLSQANANPKELFITAIVHRAGNNYLFEAEKDTAQYQAELSCIRRELPWTPQQNLNSQATHIYGLQTAKVCGPAGEEIYTDKYGRVKVQFHWDRLGKYNENSSAWVRVASAWAGNNFGMVSIPRIGQEVIVQFLEGNPDRPVITGSLYNEDHLPPWDLPANATQSGILSRSSVGASPDNANAIRFEDKRGAEEVWIQAEKDQRIQVKNNESHSIGVDRSKSVGNNETVSIGVDRTETVGSNETISVGADRTKSVGSNETITIGANQTKTVVGNETSTIQQNRTKTVIADEKSTIVQNQSTNIGMNQKVSVGLNKVETVNIAKALNVGAGYAVTVGAGHAVTVGGAMNTAVGLAQFEQVGLSKKIDVGQTFSISVGERFELRVGAASLILKADGTIQISGSNILIEADGPVEINGKDVDIN